VQCILLARKSVVSNVAKTDEAAVTVRIRVEGYERLGYV